MSRRLESSSKFDRNNKMVGKTTRMSDLALCCAAVGLVSAFSKQYMSAQPMGGSGRGIFTLLAHMIPGRVGEAGRDDGLDTTVAVQKTL